ncbi:MAG: RluA family pseudouridine synthase, partial [bacterium]|nr:RluA family pseudouridine synthase [bacterium]
LVNALLHYCKDLSGIGGVERPGIVPRLDKDTTGVIVVAKNDTAHLGLSLAFRRRQIDKNYIAICYGVPEARQGSIDTPIGRHPKERQRMAVSESGRNARTNYEVEEAFAGATQLRCHPVTGRTHQIRVHFAHIGHALIGDPLYAGRQWRNFEDPSFQAYCRSFPRQALHAASIAFRHPVTEKEIRVAAELPKDIKHLCDVLRGKVTNPR